MAQNELLADIMISQPDLILGGNKIINLQKVLSIYGEITGNKKLYNDKVSKKIRDHINQLKGDQFFNENVVTIMAGMTDKHKENFANFMKWSFILYKHTLSLPMLSYIIHRSKGKWIIKFIIRYFSNLSYLLGLASFPNLYTSLSIFLAWGNRCLCYIWTRSCTCYFFRHWYFVWWVGPSWESC